MAVMPNNGQLKEEKKKHYMNKVVGTMHCSNVAAAAVAIIIYAYVVQNNFFCDFKSNC